VDQVTPIIFAGKTIDNFGTGINRVPGRTSTNDKNNTNNMILAFHYYSNVNVLGFKYHFKSFIKSSKQLNTGLMLTEFGIPSDDPNNHQSNFPIYHDLTELAEESFIS